MDGHATAWPQALRWSSDHAEPNAGRTRTALATSRDDAGVAEWLGTGLQSRLRGFDSRHSLACLRR
jgi:hypothetical protein